MMREELVMIALEGQDLTSLDDFPYAICTRVRPGCARPIGPPGIKEPVRALRQMSC
jgi:hypothetical protein